MGRKAKDKQKRKKQERRAKNPNKQRKSGSDYLRRGSKEEGKKSKRKG